MHRYRDQIALVAALLAPLAITAALVPLRTTSLSGANAALVLVVVIVAVSTNGHRLAGALAALSSAVWFDFFLTEPYQRFTITKASPVVARPHDKTRIGFGHLTRFARRGRCGVRIGSDPPPAAGRVRASHVS